MTFDFMEILFGVIWTLALCGCFNGARRLMSQESGRGGSIELAASLFLALGLTAASYIQYQQSFDLLTAINTPIPSAPWSEESRTAFDPELEGHREITLTNASEAYRHNGELREYLNPSGEWEKYSPTEKDIKAREKLVTLRATLESVSDDRSVTAQLWLIPPLFALVLGLLSGGLEQSRKNGG